jgi:hypothetical protein
VHESQKHEPGGDKGHRAAFWMVFWAFTKSSIDTRQVGILRGRGNISQVFRYRYLTTFTFSHLLFHTTIPLFAKSKPAIFLSQSAIPPFLVSTLCLVSQQLKLAAYFVHCRCRVGWGRFSSCFRVFPICFIPPNPGTP